MSDGRLSLLLSGLSVRCMITIEKKISGQAVGIPRVSQVQQAQLTGAWQQHQ